MNKLSSFLMIAGICCSVFFQTVIPVYAADASLSFSPTSKNVTVGEKFDVTIMLNTGGAQTAATDANITFDSGKLVLLDIANGTTYDQYIGKTINNTGGTAAITGIATSADVLFSGSGTFATLKFQATSAGAATVNFDFTAGNRNDSNVAEYGSSTDILTTVANGSYTITGTGTYTPPTVAPPAAAGTSGSTGTTTTTTSRRAVGGTSGQQLPVTASPLPGVLVTFAGIALVWFGILTGKTS